MKISVVLTTIRLGGFDILLNSLAAQILPRDDWELIVVDEFFTYREEGIRKIMRERSDLAGINFRHLPPKRYTLVMDDDISFNYGLTFAAGELVMFLTDYIWLPPTLLAAHWGVYKASGRSMSVCGYMDHYECPPLRQSSMVINNTAEEVISDAPPAEWSAFEKEFDTVFAGEWFTAKNGRWQERYGGHKLEEVAEGVNLMSPSWFYMAVNHSIPLRILKILNGLDQRYTGYYGLTDIDLGIRASSLGWHFCIADDFPVTLQVNTKNIPKMTKYVYGPSSSKMPEMNERLRRIFDEKESARTPKGYGAFE